MKRNSAKKTSIEIDELVLENVTAEEAARFQRALKEELTRLAAAGIMPSANPHVQNLRLDMGQGMVGEAVAKIAGAIFPGAGR